MKDQLPLSIPFLRMGSVPPALAYSPPDFPSWLSESAKLAQPRLSAPCCLLAKNISATGIQFGKCFTNRVSWENVLISLIKARCATLLDNSSECFGDADPN